jgi:formate dehydrogenase subunit gamma
MAETVVHTGDVAVARAASEEDVVVGNEIVRHKLSSRFIHWTVALTFVVCLLSGLPIWTPIFGWMAAIFGGLSVCRWLHPWAGVVFIAFTLVMFIAWIGDMRFERGEGRWFGPRLIQYFRYQGDDSDVGKYNGGQKIYFFLSVVLGVLLFASGFVLWWPGYFTAELRQWSVVVHDATFILFVAAMVVHVYLGTAAEPGTFGSMTRGTVSKPWARLHHPRWYREVTGDRDRQV